MSREDLPSTTSPRKPPPSAADEPEIAQGGSPKGVETVAFEPQPAGLQPEPATQFPGAVHVKTSYRLIELIASGGMGLIYRAFDDQLQRELAIKVLRHEYAHDSRIVNRFVNESIIKGCLQHPGIAPVFASGTCEDGRPFYAMKLIDGQTLSRLLSLPDRGQPLGLLGVFSQVCQTMAYVHAQGIVHLDLKPSNIMVAEFGKVQIIDWGLSRRIGSPDPDATEHDFRIEFAASSRVSDTQSGNVRGTPAYMAPEQARGELLDARTDVFSLGAILCETLTGQPVYRADHPQDILLHAVRGATGPAMVALSKSETAKWLIDLVKRCLSPNPHDRPAHAGELARELTDFQESALSLANSDMLRFFELSPDLFCIAGFDGCFRRVNSNFMLATGYSEQELLSQPFLNFVHPDDRQQTIGEMGRILQGLPTERFRNRYLRRDGSILHLEWVAKSVVSEALTYAVARDVSPR